jgi:endonuclease G, mitochondrial
MEAKHVAAAIPLIIALAGTAGLPTSQTGASLRSRAAPGAEDISAAVAKLDNQQRNWFDDHTAHFGIPKPNHSGNWTLVVRQGYTLAHNNVDRIADWVAFHETSDYVNGKEARPDSGAFKADPVLLKGRRAELDDYKGFNGVYDRGHQCAAGDSKGRGKTVIRESFFLSNMTPQASQLNQQKWRMLEDRIQKLAARRGELWVITGPVFEDEDGDGVIDYYVIGKDEVAVPTHYFKIVLAHNEHDSSKWDAMCFLMPNKKVTADFDSFLVSIDEVEKLTGYDFFPDMPADQQAKLESAIATTVWSTN